MTSQSCTSIKSGENNSTPEAITFYRVRLLAQYSVRISELVSRDCVRLSLCVSRIIMAEATEHKKTRVEEFEEAFQSVCKYVEQVGRSSSPVSV